VVILGQGEGLTIEQPPALEGAAYRRQDPVKFRTSSTAHFSAVQARPAAEVEILGLREGRPSAEGSWKAEKGRKMAKAVSPSLRLPAIRLLCIALLFGPTFSHTAAIAEDRYGILDHANRVRAALRRWCVSSVK
jgi:hypothetical protein